MEEYLDSLSLPKTLRDRVHEVISAFEILCRSDLDKLFVSDALDEETQERRYPSVWGFAGPYWMEARNFDQVFDLDIAPYYRSINYLGVQYDGLTLAGHVHDSSRMVVEVGTAKVDYSYLSATGTNCGNLIAIMKELLIPNLLPPSFPDEVAQKPPKKPRVAGTK